MELEKPLHVQVAEALGYGECSPCGEDGAWHFTPGNGTAYRDDFTPIWRDTFDYGEWHRCEHDLNFVPDFRTDWSATGPLIEKYRLTVWFEAGEWSAGELDSAPYEGPWLEERQDAATPLIAVCKTLIGLAAAGKLQAA